jgi:hypothetical protein
MTGLITDLKVNNRPTRLWTCPSRKTNHQGWTQGVARQVLVRIPRPGSIKTSFGNTRVWDDVQEEGTHSLYTTHFCIRSEWITWSPPKDVLPCACLRFGVLMDGDMMSSTSFLPSLLWGFRINDIITITCLWLNWHPSTKHETSLLKHKLSLKPWNFI